VHEKREHIRDAVAYVMKKVESVKGINSSSRDNGLVRAICILRDAGLTEAEATVVMLDWNRSGMAVPQWPLRQITRAVSRMYARGG